MFAGNNNNEFFNKFGNEVTIPNKIVDVDKIKKDGFRLFIEGRTFSTFNKVTYENLFDPNGPYMQHDRILLPTNFPEFQELIEARGYRLEKENDVYFIYRIIKVPYLMDDIEYDDTFYFQIGSIPHQECDDIPHETAKKEEEDFYTAKKYLYKSNIYILNIGFV